MSATRHAPSSWTAKDGDCAQALRDVHAIYRLRVVGLLHELVSCLTCPALLIVYFPTKADAVVDFLVQSSEDTPLGRMCRYASLVPSEPAPRTGEPSEAESRTTATSIYFEADEYARRPLEVKLRQSMQAFKEQHPSWNPNASLTDEELVDMMGNEILRSRY